MIYHISIYMLVSQALFAKTFGGTNEDQARSIIQTSDGGYALAGWTGSFGAGLSDFLVLKLASDGSIQWARTFGGTTNDSAWSIIQTTDGGYALAGWTASFGAGEHDFLIVKIDGSGLLQWAKTFGGANRDEAYSIIQTSDGGYAVAGYTASFGSVGDFLILKLNASGDLEWARTFGGNSIDLACSIIQTTDGGYAVAGHTTSFGAGNYDFLIVKIDGSGLLQWARTFGGLDVEWVSSIIQTSDGGYAVAGHTTSFGAGGFDILILKLNSVGDIIWVRVLGGPGGNPAYSIVQTTDGGYAIGGMPSIIKLSASGDLEWSRQLYSTHGVSSAVQTTDGGYAITGYLMVSFPPPDYDFFILKLGPDGNYTDCVFVPSLSVFTPVPSTSLPSLNTLSPTLGMDCSPVLTTPDIRVNDVCTPIAIEDDMVDYPGITCSPFSGGILFNSPADLGINIYSVDGRVAYSGQLRQGENRISLGRGVYLWRAGTYRGKAAVR